MFYIGMMVSLIAAITGVMLASKKHYAVGLPMFMLGLLCFSLLITFYFMRLAKKNSKVGKNMQTCADVLACLSFFS